MINKRNWWSRCALSHANIQTDSEQKVSFTNFAQFITIIWLNILQLVDVVYLCRGAASRQCLQNHEPKKVVNQQLRRSLS